MELPKLLLLLQLPLVLAGAPPEAAALLALKAAVDVAGALPWRRSAAAAGVCGWPGVKQCSPDGRVKKLVLESLNLTGTLPPDSLSSFTELRVLSMKSNSLGGEIPSLSRLRNLKVLFLDGNRFSGEIPPELPALRRLKVVSLSRNAISGKIPPSLTRLPKLYVLFLQDNELTGGVPAFDQDGLRFFNVSGNSLSGEVPATRVLRRFNLSAFAGNRNLCGELVGKLCNGIHSDPFLSPPEAILSSSSGGEEKKKREKMPIIISCSVVGFLVTAAGVAVAVALSRRRRRKSHVAEGGDGGERGFSWEAQPPGKLTFCGGGGEGGEKAEYSLEELLKASAETLGRGTTGSTYKAVMETGLTVAVKRLRESSSVDYSSSSSSSFRRRAEALGLLRHQNLVPLRAFFEAQRERLLVYDYFPNGSLLSLVQGDKPLHWTSCLKIAEDVATGLAHLHEVAREVHGNLKSSNVLLGPDFECCLVDYALDGDGSDFSADMYSYGVLVLELVGGRENCKEMVENEEEVLQQGSGSGREEEKLAALVEVAVACVAAQAEDRPTAGEALRMVRAARAAASSISGGSDQSPGRWSDAVQSLPRASNGQDHMNLTERD